MNNGWTRDRKANQAVAIQSWKPWQRATGPKTPQGKATISRNAYKGGQRQELRNCVRVLKLGLATQKEFLGIFDKC